MDYDKQYNNFRNIYAPSLQPKQQSCKKGVKQQKWWIIPKRAIQSEWERERERERVDKRNEGYMKKPNKGGNVREKREKTSTHCNGLSINTNLQRSD